MFNYPPKDLINSYRKNNEFLLLWMLNNNESSCWSDLTKIINKSTLSNYLNKFLDNNYAQKLTIEKNGRKKKVYRLKSKGKERYYQLSQGKENKKLNFPPESILRHRNYDHWILWMVYNNNFCIWPDFLDEPLSINQSSLSKNLNYLMDKKGFIRKENKEYRITKAGKAAYANMLRQYDLNRQSILEAESRRIREIKKNTNEFFRRYEIKDKDIKFRYLNNIIKLPYENEKIKFTLDNEENFKKVILFLSMNHPNEFPNYISPKDFSEKYKINLTKLNFTILRIVEDNVYSTKFFRLEFKDGINYYFQSNEKLEKILNAIVEEHVFKLTYLYNLSDDFSKQTPELTLELAVNAILDEICGNLFSNGLRNSLRYFLPNYISYLAYKIEKKGELKDTFDKIEGLIWQKIQFHNFNTNVLNLSAQDNLNQALDKINDAIKSNPDNIELYYSKSKFLIENNRFRSVLELLELMQEIFPDDEKNVLMMKAYVLKEMKNLEAGLDIINKLIEIYPEDKELLNYKANWYQYLNQKEKSLEVIQNLIKEEPSNALYHDTYGEILMFFKDYKHALEEFQRTIKLNKESWFIYQTYIKMGICNNILGNIPQAVEFLNKGKEYTNRSSSDPGTKKKWVIIANLILAEIEQLK
ncbi:MAG: hypothetical protein ACFFEY_02310 [Candidatus Thorarchaeota archaeon]